MLSSTGCACAVQTGMNIAGNILVKKGNSILKKNKTEKSAKIPAISLHFKFVNIRKDYVLRP